MNWCLSIFGRSKRSDHPLLSQILAGRGDRFDRPLIRSYWRQGGRLASLLGISGAVRRVF